MLHKHFRRLKCRSKNEYLSSNDFLVSSVGGWNQRLFVGVVTSNEHLSSSLPFFVRYLAIFFKPDPVWAVSKNGLCMYRIPLILLFILLAACTSVPKEETGPPNLILIIADDMAWDDSGAYGHPTIRTPHLDGLAKAGMRFDAAFLTTSSCSPSRSSIITGRYPHQTGAEQLHWPLPVEQVTFVEKLKEAGYWTAQAGKWHLGDAVKDRFHVVNGEGLGLSSLPTDDGSGCHLWVPTLQNRPQNQPFFLWLASYDPHRVYQAHTIPDPHVAEDAIIPPYIPDAPAVREDFALYYDEISRMDSYIGQVLKELERQGVADNTLVLFMSDNGRPFPRDKTTLYDSGIKTPMIVRWPALVKAGSVSESLVSAVDIAPTFLHLAGLDPLPTFAGKDFSPILRNPSAQTRDLIIAEDHWHDHDDFGRAVRSSHFKYIHNGYPELPNTPPADALKSLTYAEMQRQRNAGTLSMNQLHIFAQPRPHEELYDLHVDPHELNNLAEDPTQAETLQFLRNYLLQWQAETGDAMPQERTPDEFDRETGDPLPHHQMPRIPKKGQAVGRE